LNATWYEITRRTCVVILDLASEEDRSLISVMVDHVSEVLEISADEIEPPPTFGSGIRSDFIHGVGKVGGKFVLILDADRVLSIPELIALQAGSDGRINDAEAIATRRIP
jgi:purine-binding chemotaxis protein CheW